ncbi:hypothetical protein K5549_016928, partial [Capra hircus]
RETSNHSEVTDFILVGFRVLPELHILLFLLFLLVYAMILLGNLGMMIIIMTDPQLNTPMYFFLGNLSFIDLFYSSVIAPKAMINFWSESKSISFAGCVTQLFLFALFIVTEGFLLAVMAYDRFIAICNPLLYSVQMSTHLCVQLVAASYFCGCISSVIEQLSAMGDRGTSNHSEVTDFILVGFRVHAELHILLFLLFLLIYTMILLGNIGMMVIIMTDPRLNTPMYFFLGNLSFIDLFYSSVIAPKAMINFWSESKSISFAGCVTQLFLFALFIVTEGFLLAVMAYDRFIAICNPLLYSVQMSAHLCVQLVAG